jgi:hypothetical protein
MGIFKGDSFLSNAEIPYVCTVIVVHLFYIATFIGLFKSVPKYINTLSILTQSFICIVLMYRFNPFFNVTEITKFDKILIFGSAIVLFTNVILVEFAKISTVGNYVYHVVKPEIETN